MHVQALGLGQQQKQSSLPDPMLLLMYKHQLTELLHSPPQGGALAEHVMYGGIQPKSCHRTISCLKQTEAGSRKRLLGHEYPLYEKHHRDGLSSEYQIICGKKLTEISKQFE